MSELSKSPPRRRHGSPCRPPSNHILCLLIWSPWGISKNGHSAAWGGFGRPGMTEELKESGLNVGQPCVGRLMRQDRISVVRTRKPRVTADNDHKCNIAPNLLDRVSRQFAQHCPTNCGVGSYLRLVLARVCLCGILHRYVCQQDRRLAHLRIAAITVCL